MSYISEGDLQVIKSLIVDQDVEICGFLLSIDDENRLQLYIDRYGEKLATRGTCKWSRYSKYMWHTHNRGLIAYPSPEDILHVIRYREVEISLVFTIWGIWKIQYNGVKIRGENEIKYIYNVSKIYFDRLYHETGRGRELNIPAVMNTIIKVNLKINEIPLLNNRFNLQFKLWDEIREAYVI